jgi:hypothetical protein
LGSSQTGLVFTGAKEIIDLAFAASKKDHNSRMAIADFEEPGV